MAGNVLRIPILVDMYISYPADKKTDRAILYMTDINGVQLLQNKL
jgi:hypothetical protein